MDFALLWEEITEGRGKIVKTESVAKTILLHSRLTCHAKKRPTSINGIKAAKLQNATFRATTTLLDSENPEKLAMIPHRAEPKAIATRRKVGIEPDARAPDISASTINSYLDRGITGIWGPHIETAEEAQALVDASLYGPDGQRSWGGGRGNYNNSALIDIPGSNLYGERTEYMRQN